MTTKTITTRTSELLQKGKEFVKKCQTNFSKGVIIGLTALSLSSVFTSCGPSPEELKVMKDQDHAAWVEGQRTNVEANKPLVIMQKARDLSKKAYEETGDYKYNHTNYLSMIVDDGKEVSMSRSYMYTPDRSEGPVPSIQVDVKDGEKTTTGYITFQNTDAKVGGPWDVITLVVGINGEGVVKESCEFESDKFESQDVLDYLTYFNTYSEKLVNQYLQSDVFEQEKYTYRGESEGTTR